MAITHFDEIARSYDYWKKRNHKYYQQLKSILSIYMKPNKSVLDFGCGTGDLIQHISPKNGVGYDPSSEMIRICKMKYPRGQWTNQLPKENEFDYVYSADVIEHVPSLAVYLLEIKQLMHHGSKTFLIFANPWWEPLLLILEKLKMKMPEGSHYRYPHSTIKYSINQVGMKIDEIQYFYPKIPKLGLIEVWQLSKK
jgi:ubiquinone/menaquinone biosynthesis C-methylase UbiE